MDGGLIMAFRAVMFSVQSTVRSSTPVFFYHNYVAYNSVE